MTGPHRGSIGLLGIDPFALYRDSSAACNSSNAVRSGEVIIAIPNLV